VQLSILFLVSAGHDSGHDKGYEQKGTAEEGDPQPPLIVTEGSLKGGLLLPVPETASTARPCEFSKFAFSALNLIIDAFLLVV
jgi:hypothetical protein